MLEFAGDILTVITALWLYDSLKVWKSKRQYHG